VKPILLLPGMGADHRLHGMLLTRRPIRALDWPPFQPRWSFTDYARSIIEREGIAEGDVIGGTSMGGMVALEIANQMRLRRVLLISSAIRWRQVTPFLRGLSRLSPVAPLGLLPFAPTVPGLPAGHGLAMAMARSADPTLLRWSCRAMATWNGYHGDPERIRRIHGTHDGVIPAWGHPEVTIAGGGHLLPLTHAPAVAAFIDRHGE
jgi:pimeloyl-ACP methyl ester carboxylesterase